MAQGGCRCPFPGGIQRQAGQGLEPPGLEEGVPSGRWEVGLELDDF